MKASNDLFAKLDLRDLPVAETINLLRTLALQLLEAVLDESPRAHLPRLLDWVSSDDADLVIATASPAIYVKTKRRLRRLADIGLRNILRIRFFYIRSGRQGGNRHLASLALRGQLSPPVWTSHAADELVRRYDVDVANRFPTDFWRLLGLYAWTDLEFQKQTAHLLERALRQRALFDLGGFRTITLSPECYWLLIGLAASKVEFNWPFWIWPARRRQRLAIRRLQAEATRLGLENGWASGWDQWALLAAWRKWGDEQLSQAFKEALPALPLRGATGDHQSSLALSGWEKAIPAWFLAWNRIYQNKRLHRE